MNWHACCLYVEPSLLELLLDPANNVKSLWLGELQDSCREHINILFREVEEEDHVCPFPALKPSVFNARASIKCLHQWPVRHHDSSSIIHL